MGVVRSAVCLILLLAYVCRHAHGEDVCRRYDLQPLSIWLQQITTKSQESISLLKSQTKRLYNDFEGLKKANLKKTKELEVLKENIYNHLTSQATECYKYTETEQGDIEGGEPEQQVCWRHKSNVYLTDLDTSARFGCLNCKCCTIKGSCYINLVKRSEWKAEPPTKIITLATPVSMVIIHESSNAEECLLLGVCKKEMKKLQDLHMKSGSFDVRFNFIIGGDGRTYEGRGWNTVGGLDHGWKDVALEFSIMGKYKTKLPDTAAIQELKRLLDCGVKSDKITSDYKLYYISDLYSVSPETKQHKLYQLIQTFEHHDANRPVRHSG